MFERLQGRLRAFDDEDLAADDYEEAARFGNRCRAGGVAGSAIDFLTCAAASRRDWAVFTTDADFPGYASVMLLQLHKARETGRPA